MKTLTLKNITAVYRQYRCADCGEAHTAGVHVDIEDYGSGGDYANNRPVVGRWVCNECGEEWWVGNVRLTVRDLRDCEF